MNFSIREAAGVGDELLPAASPESSPYRFFCVPRDALQHGPFQQPLSNNKNVVLLYFIFVPFLHLSGATTLPYSAYDPGAMGGGTHWLRMIMLLHRAEMYEQQLSGGGFAAIWFCCSKAERSRAMLTLWPVGNGFVCYYCIKH